MSKLFGHGFDEGVCEECPHRQEVGEGEGIIGSLSNAEGKVLEAAFGEAQFECGLCGCPLKNLAAISNGPPENCPFIEEHAEE